MSKDPHKSHQAEHEGSGEEHHPDDPIVIPKGSSRTRFLMTALLAVLVLTTFTVSHEVVDVLTGRNKGKSAYMSWKRPEGTVEEMKAGDFMMVKQDLSRAQAILTGGRTSKDTNDVQTARHIIANSMAKAAGVEVTDEELRNVILPRFGGSETYQQILDHYRTTAHEFENTLRALIRVERYISLLSETSAMPEPSSVVDQWKKAHREYSLEVVELDTESYADEAKAACPTGDELQKWFEALPDAEKNVCRQAIPAKVSAEFAWFAFDPPTRPDKLLEKFPRPESEKPEDVARTWYEANKNVLYKKPGLPPGRPPTPDDYVPFEEVKDRALAQGIANQSALDWLNDLKLRESRGEEIHFASDATSVGFGFRQDSTPRARGDWKSLNMAWGGTAILEALYAATSEAGKVLPDVVVDPKGLFVARILEKQASRMPEYAEFQEKVHDYWVTKKQGELALAKLEALRAKLPSQPDPKDPANTSTVEPDSAKWQAAAQELGLPIEAQEWLDAGAPLQFGKVTPKLLYMRQIAGRYGDVVGAVPKPELSNDRKKAWLSRVVGFRDPDLERLTPLDYENAKYVASSDSRKKFYESTFGSDEYLKQRYGLELEAWRREDTEKSSTPK